MAEITLEQKQEWVEPVTNCHECPTEIADACAKDDRCLMEAAILADLAFADEARAREARLRDWLHERSIEDRSLEPGEVMDEMDRIETEIRAAALAALEEK